jgi:hypothetical protein
LKSTNAILNHFKTGYRCILLLHRNKDGCKGNAQRKSYKKISSCPEEWDEIVAEFSAIQEQAIIPYRIYASVNERDLNKAIHEFKKRQLAYDYGQTESDQKFYTDLNERFFSCMAAPGSRKETQFLFDCDDELIYEMVIEKVDKDLIIWDYPTKSGRHVITKPFNPKRLDPIHGLYRNDDMIFIK